jgi:hypothetical protein
VERGNVKACGVAQTKNSKAGWIIGAGIAATAAGAVAFNTFSVHYAPTESGMESYLSAVQQKQLEYFTKNKNHASNVEALTAIGLTKPPDGFTIDYRGSSPLDYCWLGKVRGIPLWFTVSKDAVQRTTLPSDGPPPISCARPKP